MCYTLHKQVKDVDTLRGSFNALANKTFGLSFEGWYQHGYRTDRYIPYALADGETVIANASANIIDYV